MALVRTQIKKTLDKVINTVTTETLWTFVIPDLYVLEFDIKVVAHNDDTSSWGGYTRFMGVAGRVDGSVPPVAQVSYFEPGGGGTGPIKVGATSFVPTLVWDAGLPGIRLSLYNSHATKKLIAVSMIEAMLRNNDGL